MRRKDRERSAAEGYDILDAAPYGTLAVSRADGSAYAVPLSPARDGRSLYFHCARRGMKNDALTPGKEVTVVFVSRAEVPNLIGTKAIGRPDPADPASAKVASKLFTTEFASAVVRGPVFPVTDEAEIVAALETICRRFTPRMMAFFEQAVRQSLKDTAVYRIDIASITAKCKEFDEDGYEIKRPPAP